MAGGLGSVGAVGLLPLDTSTGTFTATTNLYNNSGLWQCWSFNATFTIQAGSKVGIGMNGLLPDGNRNLGLFINTTAQTFAVEYLDKANSSFFQWGTTSFVFNAAHVYRVQLRKGKRYISGFLQDTTTGQFWTFRDIPTASKLMLWPVGNPAAFVIGTGQVTVGSSSFYVEDPKYPSVVFMGDQTHEGIKIPNNQVLYPMKYAQNHQLVNVMGWFASSVTHSSLNATMAAFLASYTPSTVYLCCGSNDERNDPTGWMPTRIAITNALVGAGITVKQCQIIPEVLASGGYDNTVANTAITTQYPTNVDIRTPLFANGSTTNANSAYYVDKANLNGAGHTLLAPLFT